MEVWQDIATLVASIVVILGAIGVTARWAVKGVINEAIQPLRDDIHAIDLRLTRVEEAVRIVGRLGTTGTGGGGGAVHEEPPGYPPPPRHG